MISMVWLYVWGLGGRRVGGRWIATRGRGADARRGLEMLVRKQGKGSERHPQA